MIHSAVVCPFCPLLCDDLEVEAEGNRLRLRSGGCAHARERFATLAGAEGARAGGRPATTEDALERAASLLAGARSVLISGLGCDVDGMRAVLRLAERLGAIVDHGASDGAFANLRAMQRSGWVTATFAEVRNRADLLLFFGTDGGPFAEVLERRLFAPGATVFAGHPPVRRRLAIGPGAPAGAEIVLPWPAEELHLAAALLRARLAGRPVGGTGRTRPPVATLDRIAEALRAARYAVIVWDAAAMPAEVAEPAIANIAGLLLELNRETRAVGLPLAASHHIVTASQVCTWQWGVPLRTAATAAGPEHDPQAFAAPRLLANGRVDALLWISAFERRPPPAGVPTVALLAPGPEPVAADVVLEVGIPGIDHAGTAFRMDPVVALPLRQLRDGGLPGVAELCDAIASRLPARA